MGLIHTSPQEFDEDVELRQLLLRSHRMPLSASEAAGDGQTAGKDPQSCLLQASTLNAAPSTNQTSRRRGSGLAQALTPRLEQEVVYFSLCGRFLDCLGPEARVGSYAENFALKSPILLERHLPPGFKITVCLQTNDYLHRK
ncbi:hypothetical protein XENOCAPTIV_001480 [Xenoophorus captivus]|uniref:Uncharacterized protein n=1 Tax=Xenoophorus captivus TaxID=1517983 RepID=A0ABV0REU2_9TELE